MKISDTTLPNRPAIRPPAPVAKPQGDARPRPAWPRLVSRQGRMPARARELLERAEREQESIRFPVTATPAAVTATPAPPEAAAADTVAPDDAAPRRWRHAVAVFIALLAGGCGGLLALTFAAR